MNIAVFVSGIAAVIGQTIIIREEIALFSGNELVSGIVLCFWLLWTGIGSLIYSRIDLRIEPKKIYAILLFLLGFALVFSLMFIRIAPKIFSLPFGEIIDFQKIILISILTLCPTCIIVGALFPAGSAILLPRRVYFIEGLGSFTGGIILSFLLINILPPFGILAILLALLLFAGLFCLSRRSLLFLCIIPLFAFLKINDIEYFFRKMQMRGQNLIGLYESRYGTIAITKSETQLNIYTSGFFDFAYPDLYSAEEAVQYPLLLHNRPEDVLLIGGGISGGIEQILKHRSIKKLVCLEFDPKVIEIGEKYINPAMSDNRLSIIPGDGRFYIKNSEEKFDCIIINLPDPINVQLNRYYTKEFFREVRKRLKSGGLFSVRVNYSPDILSPLYSKFLGTIYATLRQVFQNIYILPAAKATYIATEYEVQGRIRDLLKEEIHKRNLNLTYVNSYYFDYNLNEERIEYVRTSIARSNPYVNSDLKPVCYYFSAVLWGGIVSQNLKNIFMKLFGLHPALFFLLLIPVLFLLYHRSVVYLSVFAVGATSISVELILLILFQVFYGYVYAWLGVIIGLFMLGVTSGTLLFMRLKNGNFLLNSNQTSVLFLSNIQISIGFYLLMIILFAVLRIPNANYIIAMLIFIGGFLGGIHFPLSIEILGPEKAGILYGVDLLGAGFSAILTAMIFIPIVGIIYSLIVFVLLNLFVAIGLRLHR